MGVTGKRNFKGWCTKKIQYKGGNCLKRGLGQVADLRRSFEKKGAVVFLRGGVDTPMHTMS